MGDRPKLKLTSQDVGLSVTTTAFDISVAEIFLPLIVGAKLIIISQGVAADGFQLLRAVQTHQPTFMQPTPATWRLLLAAGWQGNPSLKMVSTGEALSQDLAHQLLPLGKELWNLYGPTETTIWSAAYRVESAQKPITIGYPIANTQLYVLDRHLQPVPIGVTGELHIGGVGLAHGYLNRPELTQEKFIPDPFSPIAGAQLYKTGDLARRLPDGQIECLGRLDHQVKIRGFRIELGEIEAALAQHPLVQNTVVVADGSDASHKRLIAYLVLRSPINIAELRHFLKDTLPTYMIPSAFVVLEALPLTPNGKIDRRALPASERVQQAQNPSTAIPQNVLELQLLQICKKS